MSNRNHILRCLGTPLLLVLCLPVAAGAGASGQGAERAFARDVQPLLHRYCLECHGEKKKGGLDLRSYPNAASILQHRAVFETMLQKLAAHEMPPAPKTQPTPAERDRLTRWLADHLFACDCDHPDPGRVTLRRLNRSEYNNTIRDLTGMTFRPAEDFPGDDTGYGFDNIGDVLSLSPVLFEKYLAAAERVLEAAIVFDPATNGAVLRLEAETLESTAPGGEYNDAALLLGREGEVFADRDFKAGDYVLRVRGFGQQAGTELPRMEIRFDGKALGQVDVEALEAAPQVYEIPLHAAEGRHRFAAAYLNNYNNPQDPPDRRDRNLIVDYLEIVGPIRPDLPESHRRIFVCGPTPATKTVCAREIIGNFARKAYRRPVTAAELERLMKLYSLAAAGGEPFQQAVKVALSAVLVSPHFLFLGQGASPTSGAVQLVDEFALASRLSYFLWSSMPDDELFRLAGRGALRKNLEAQVRRMLKDPKSGALVENFTGQWLQLRNLDLIQPDTKLFPEFNMSLREAMQRETEMFFENILREDRSVLEFLDADYTFVNAPLAALYGIPEVQGDGFQRVSLRGTMRGGLFTQASILTLTSNPTRTSPVKRGKWVLDNILGTPPPPPPPDVPDLDDSAKVISAASLRDRMEQHRSNPNCATCHLRMDGIGFSFEHFDAIGRWREKDGDFPIDASGTLASGEAFQDAAALKVLLRAGKRDEFLRCLTGKMLTYALGRGLEYCDRCVVDDVTKKLAKKRYVFSALVLEIVKSVPFQHQRTESASMARSEP